MQNKKSYSVEAATLLLEQYCIYQDRCHLEVERKLKQINMIPAACELIIIHLIQHDFLNETRFAKSYVRGKFTIKKWGKRKIVAQLKWKGVSAYNIKIGLNEINEDDYIKTIQLLVAKKTPLIKGATVFIKRKKLYNYLIGKGYEYAVIKPIVDEVL